MALVRCVRCGRQIDDESEEFIDWEAVLTVDTQDWDPEDVQVCCPDCLTAEETSAPGETMAWDDTETLYELDPDNDEGQD